MSVVIYGLNYLTAPVEVREKTVVVADKLDVSLTTILEQTDEIKEIFILSTCNRTEFYYFTDHDSSKVIDEWLVQHSGLNETELKKITYRYYNEEAAKHLTRVASGLDSQVLGEPQIMGQVRDSFHKAKLKGTVGDELDMFFRVCLKTAKNIRTKTEIGHNPVSVAYAAVFLAGKIYEDLESKKALLIGAGETISLVAQHLKSAGIEDITIANRTLKNAVTLAKRYQANAIALSSISENLPEIDIIISSTGAPNAVIKKEHIEIAMRSRKRSPMFLVDIAVPRDIEQSVEDVPNVYLYTIDQLTEVINSNLDKRQKAAQAADEFVLSGAQIYLKEQRIRAGNSVLRIYRENVEHIRASELEKIKMPAITPQNQAKVIEDFSHSLTNKLTHKMTTILRSAIADNQLGLLENLKGLYTSDDQIDSNSARASEGQNDST